MDRIMELVAESVHLRQELDVISSQFARTAPEVVASRDTVSCCEPTPSKRHGFMKPPRRNRPSRTSQDSGLPAKESGDSRRQTSRDLHHNDLQIPDEDKENTCNISRCRAARPDSLTPRKLVVSPSPPSRSTYRECLGSVIASYLSPLRLKDPLRLHRQGLRYFGTPTSSGDETLVRVERSVKQPDNDQISSNDNPNNDDNNNDMTNTSVWLSDSATSVSLVDDTETSSGVGTAASSNFGSRQAAATGDDVNDRQAPEGSRSLALCDVSRISADSSTSVAREQLSSLGVGGLPDLDGVPSSAFHSTFNYPLHSTLRCASIRYPSPVPDSPTLPVRQRQLPVLDEVCRTSENTHRCPVKPSRHRDLPPPSCRRCEDAIPLRRQRARAQLERRRPVVDRRQRSGGQPDDDNEVQPTSISLQATRGSLPDLSDLSADLELYWNSQRDERSSHRQKLQCDRDQFIFDFDTDMNVHTRRRGESGCAHCRCKLHSRRSVGPVVLRQPRRSYHLQPPSHRSPSSAARSSCHRPQQPVVTAHQTLQRPTGCLPSIRSRASDTAVVMETRRRRQREGVALGCGQKRLLSKKFKLFSNILCSAGAIDVTQLTTLGHV